MTATMEPTNVAQMVVEHLGRDLGIDRAHLLDLALAANDAQRALATGIRHATDHQLAALLPEDERLAEEVWWALRELIGLNAADTVMDDTELVATWTRGERPDVPPLDTIHRSRALLAELRLEATR